MGTRTNTLPSAAPSFPVVLPKTLDNEAGDVGGAQAATASSTTTLEPQAIPFTISLQEIGNRPGQFQWVLKPQPEQAPAGQSKLYGKHYYAEPRSLPTLGYDVSPLYRAVQPPSPLSPVNEDQGWSELNTLPPDFVSKVAPDWEPALVKEETLARSQSTRLSDIKARIKKSGKGFIVRLRKGSTSEASGANLVKDVHLTSERPRTPPAFELSSGNDAVELDSKPVSAPVFEIGPSERSNSEQTQQSTIASPLPERSRPPQNLNTNAVSSSTFGRPYHSQRFATRSNGGGSFREEQWLSDAETLTHDVPLTRDVWEDFEDGVSSIDPASTYHSRSSSPRSMISIIPKTPTNSRSTRLESIWGPQDSQAQQEGSDFQSEGPTPSIRVSLRSGVRKARKPQGPRAHLRSKSSTSARFQAEAAGETSKLNPHKRDARTGSLKSKPVSKLVDIPVQRRSKSFSGLKRASSARSETLSYAASTVIEPQSYPDRRKLKVSTQNLPQEAEDTSSGDEANTPTAEHSTTVSNSHIGSVRPVRTPDRSPRPAAAAPLNNAQSSPGNATPAVVGAIPLSANYETRQSSGPQGGILSTFTRLAVSATLSQLSHGIKWLQDQYGQEPTVPAGHVRVRWTCQCGESLHDDFIEKTPGAARMLEAFLNRPQTRSPGTPSSDTHSSFSSLNSSIFSNPQGSHSTFSSQSSFSPTTPSNSRYSPTTLRHQNPYSVIPGSWPTPSWLLTCANEGRYTTKVVHLDMCPSRIRSDKDLALTLREHYNQLNRRWFRWLRLRGLTTIDFVQFEVHRNRFADIRKCPDMPPAGPKSEYDFQPIDLVPPVGSKYLLHLFKHPEDYDGELITYLRAPKRRERLEVGVGWGINLVEGFLADRVWTLVIGFFALGSLIFAVVWVSVRKDDVQGAFGVAAWMTTLAGLSVAWAQACLD